MYQSVLLLMIKLVLSTILTADNSFHAWHIHYCTACQLNHLHPLLPYFILLHCASSPHHTLYYIHFSSAVWSLSLSLLVNLFFCIFLYRCVLRFLKISFSAVTIFCTKLTIYVLNGWMFAIHHFFVNHTILDIKYCGDIVIGKEYFGSIGVDGKKRCCTLVIRT